MKITRENYMLELAEAQFSGFAQGYYFKSIYSLIVSMGLTEKEWKSLKKKEMINQLENKEIEEIDNHFKEKRLNQSPTSQTKSQNDFPNGEHNKGYEVNQK